MCVPGAVMPGAPARSEGGTRWDGHAPVPGIFSRRPHPVLNFQGGAEMRVKITLACTECKQRNYDTKKNKKNDPDRLELKKYCRFCRKHTLHSETK